MVALKIASFDLPRTIGEYDTVTGIIGNTHRVSSDSAPITAANHIERSKTLAVPRSELT
jgi:hypothetical protein